MRLPFALSIFFLALVLLHCSFGSIGDTNRENLQILQNIITLQRNQRTATPVQIQFLGDEIDRVPESWSLRSASVSFELTAERNSSLTWETGSFRVNPAPANQERTHSPFTVPLDLPQTDPYAVSYPFVNPGQETLVKSNPTSIPTGFVHASERSRSVPDTPLGILALVQISWEEIFLNIRITSPSPKNLRVLLRSGSTLIRPKCRVNLSPDRMLALPIAFRYGNLFRDRSDLGGNNALLSRVSALPGYVLLSNFSETDLFEAIQRNLTSEDLVWVIPGCFPGVSL